ncbi:hypothetical protein MR478_08910 [bacterium]|nr:hypothetical protein [bacterium]
MIGSFKDKQNASPLASWRFSQKHPAEFVEMVKHFFIDRGATFQKTSQKAVQFTGFLWRANAVY